MVPPVPQKEELKREEEVTSKLKPLKEGWSPEQRLSWHFSGVLYPQLQDGYKDAERMLKKMGHP